MRKLIVVILASIIPASIYIAGCRQDRTAAFPKSPEMAALAKTPESADPTKPPVIPAAPIDKSIMNMPTQPNATLARANAVQDKSRKLAGSQPPEGLFTLPGETTLAQAPQSPRDYQAAPAAITPIPSGREFWSRPANAPMRTSRPINVPEDVSAMMPASSEPIMAPPSYYNSPAPSYAPPPGAKLLPPEAVPGIFDAAEPLSYSSGGGQTAPVRFESRGGDALGAPPPSSQTTMRRTRQTRKRPSEAGPIRLDLDGLLGARRPSEVMMSSSVAHEPAPVAVVRSIPGAPVYEPLPEPIPIEEYYAMMARENGVVQTATFAAPVSVVEPKEVKQPAAKKSGGVPFLPIPDVKTPTAKKSEEVPASLPLPVVASAPKRMEAPAMPPTPLEPPTSVNPKLATLLDSNAVREALAPLPDISTVAKTKAPGKSAPIALPPPVADVLPSPELTAAKTVLMNAVEPLEESGKGSGPGMSKRDFFRTDFWEKPSAALKVAEESLESKPVEKVELPDLKLPEMMPATPLWVDDVEKKVEKKVEKASEPRKVKLTPIRRELGKIDAETEVPPLRF